MSSSARQPGSKYALGNFALDRPRLPIGHWLIDLPDTLVNGTMRVHLWNAHVSATLRTSSTVVRLNLVALSSTDVMVLEVNASRASDGEPVPAPIPQWVAEPADSTWAGGEPKYVYNPKPSITTAGEVVRCEQVLLGGGSFTTAYQYKLDPRATQVRVFFAITGVLTTGSADAATALVTNALNSYLSCWQRMSPGGTPTTRHPSCR